MKNKDGYNVINTLIIPFNKSLILALIQSIIGLGIGFLEPLMIVFRQSFIDETLFSYNNKIGIENIVKPFLIIIMIMFLQQSSDVIKIIISKRILLKIRIDIQKNFLKKHLNLDYFYIENKDSCDLIARVNDNPEQKLI